MDGWLGGYLCWVVLVLVVREAKGPLSLSPALRPTCIRHKEREGT